MQETFFTTKQAAEITGCTLRQLQYWRESGVVVPVIAETGTGRSIYYSRSNLIELTAIAYWLSIGLSFELARETLKALKEKEPEVFNSAQRKRLMLWRSPSDQSFYLAEFDLERVTAAWLEGLPIVPVWLDVIYQRVETRLKGWEKCA
jgi:DNA-binding transcriptional MerR regulator